MRTALDTAARLIVTGSCRPPARPVTHRRLSLDASLILRDEGVVTWTHHASEQHQQDSYGSDSTPPVHLAHAKQPNALGVLAGQSLRTVSDRCRCLGVVAIPGTARWVPFSSPQISGAGRLRTGRRGPTRPQPPAGHDRVQRQLFGDDGAKDVEFGGAAGREDGGQHAGQAGQHEHDGKGEPGDLEAVDALVA